jgi:POT family proton-dependent oligopeptide transporter
MMGSMLDMHDSADINADSSLQSRLVIDSKARNKSDETNAGASLSSPKTEQDQADLHENSRLPIPSNNDENDGRVASENEVHDLLHVVDKIPARLWVACIAGILERFVWYGATAPLRAWYLHPDPNILRLTFDRKLPAKCSRW